MSGHGGTPGTEEVHSAVRTGLVTDVAPLRSSGLVDP